MRTSLATRLEPRSSDPVDVVEKKATGHVVLPGNYPSEGRPQSATADIIANRAREVPLEGWRIAGRLNAARVSNEEFQALLEERRSLLDKKFQGKITRREVLRLQRVRWELDRIEDAKYGPMLDRLEAAVSRYEQFSAQLAGLRSQLKQHLPKGKHR